MFVVFPYLREGECFAFFSFLLVDLYHAVFGEAMW